MYKIVSNSLSNSYSGVVEKFVSQFVVPGLSSNNSKWPPLLNIHLASSSCSHRCIICIDGNGPMKETLLNNPKDFLKNLEAMLIETQVGSGLQEIHFDGDRSDPILPKTIPVLTEAIKLIKKYDRQVHIITNGVYLNHPALKSVLPFVDLITVSLNATCPSEHIAFTRANTWNRIMEGISQVKQFSPNTVIRISHVITRFNDGSTNLSQLKPFLNELVLKGIDRICFRFNFKETDENFINSTLNYLKSIQTESMLPVVIKPPMPRHFFRQCIAQYVSATLRSDGKLTLGAHCDVAHPAGTHNVSKLPDSFKHAVFCNRHCPSLLSAINELAERDQRLKIYGLGGSLTFLKNRLTKPSGQIIQVKGVSGLILPNHNRLTAFYDQRDSLKQILRRPETNSRYTNYQIQGLFSSFKRIKGDNASTLGLAGSHTLFDNNGNSVGRIDESLFPLMDSVIQFYMFPHWYSEFERIQNLLHDPQKNYQSLYLADNPIRQLIEYQSGGVVVGLYIEYDHPITISGQTHTRFLLDDQLCPIAFSNPNESLLIEGRSDDGKLMLRQLPSFSIFLKNVQSWQDKIQYNKAVSISSELKGALKKLLGKDTGTVEFYNGATLNRILNLFSMDISSEQPAFIPKEWFPGPEYISSKDDPDYQLLLEYLHKAGIPEDDSYLLTWFLFYDDNYRLPRGTIENLEMTIRAIPRSHMGCETFEDESKCIRALLNLYLKSFPAIHNEDDLNKTLIHFSSYKNWTDSQSMQEEEIILSYIIHVWQLLSSNELKLKSPAYTTNEILSIIEPKLLELARQTSENSEKIELTEWIWGLLEGKNNLSQTKRPV